MGSSQSSVKEGRPRSASSASGHRTGQVNDDASEEVLALQNKIAWLEHQLTIKKEEALESHRAAVMEKELDKMQAAEVSFDLISKEVQENFRANCVTKIDADWKLQKMREDILKFSQRQAVVDMNLRQALETSFWEKEIQRLEERKESLVRERQVKGYDLDDLGQRKLNSELSKLRILKEFARETVKYAKLAELKESKNKNAKAEFALKRKELNARQIYQEREYKEAYEGLWKCKQELETLDKQIKEVERDVEEALTNLHRARCSQFLVKLDDNGGGWLKVDQVSRVLRAQCYMDAIMPTEQELQNRLHSLLETHGSDPWVRAGILHPKESDLVRRERLGRPDRGGDEAKEEAEEEVEEDEKGLAPLPAALQTFVQQRAGLTSIDRLEVRVEAVVNAVLAHHALSQKHGLSCPASESHQQASDAEAEGYSPPAILWTLPPPLTPTPSSAQDLPPASPSRGKSGTGGHEEKHGTQKGGNGVEKEAASHKGQTVDTDPQYFERLFHVYSRLWEKDIVYYTVISMISDAARLHDASAIPRSELEKYFTAVDRTLRKQYPGEDEAWYGPKPFVQVTEALQDYKSRQGPPQVMAGYAPKKGEDNSDSDSGDDDDSLPPSYEGHELPNTMPANYACHYICRRINPRDVEAFSFNFNILVLGRRVNTVDVYHDEFSENEVV